MARAAAVIARARELQQFSEKSRTVSSLLLRAQRLSNFAFCASSRDVTRVRCFIGARRERVIRKIEISSCYEKLND